MSEVLEMTQPQRIADTYRKAVSKHAENASVVQFFHATFEHTRRVLGNYAAAAQSNAVLTPAQITATEEGRQKLLDDIELFFTTWLGYSTEHAGRQGQTTRIGPEPVHHVVENRDLTAQGIINNMNTLGIRFEATAKGALTVSPGRLIDAMKRDQITSYKVEIVAEVHRRADLWHV